MEDVVVGNETLRAIFGNSWSKVRYLSHEGREMHMAHDICEILGIKNVTTGIKGVDGAHRVDLENREKRYVREWNARKKVHLLTLPGVFQLIMHNRNARCKTIRNYIACRYLPAADGLVLYQGAEVNRG